MVDKVTGTPIPDFETITFGAGCFWCLDAVARRVDGFVSSVVGYAGGVGSAPDYHSLHSSGSKRGWVEAVKLTYDQNILSRGEVMELFFKSHDPTTPNQDGANFGPEYHSTIFYENEDQRLAAEKMIAMLSEDLGVKVVTTVRPWVSFVEAESEHQDYYDQNPRSRYCQIVIHPKLKKLDLLS